MFFLCPLTFPQSPTQVNVSSWSQDRAGGLCLSLLTPSHQVSWELKAEVDEIWFGLGFSSMTMMLFHSPSSVG